MNHAPVVRPARIKPVPQPITDADKQAAYDAGYKVGLKHDGDFQENPFSSRKQKLLTNKWFNGWLDGSEECIRRQKAK